MDYILRNENTRQLYHTSGNILSTLDTIFSFSSNIYLPIKNMIITIHLVVLFLPSIIHILNWYFEFINPSWLINSKQKPCKTLLKRYRKWLYWQKIWNRKFSPANNQLLEKTDKANLPMTKWHPKINWDLLSKVCCYLAPKKNWRKQKFDTDSFNICAYYGASYCATPDNIDLIPVT